MFLYIMRGVSNSGKSTIIKELFNPNNVLSSDAFRIMYCGTSREQMHNKVVFDKLREALRYRLSSGVAYTVIDATSLKFNDVKDYLAIAKEFGVGVKVISITPPTLSELVDRNKKRADEGGLNVPTEVLESQIKRYENNTAVFEKNVTDYEEYHFHKINLKFPIITTRLKRDILERNTCVDSINEDELAFAIGDVHGCGNEFRQIISEIHDYANSIDKVPVIYQLGDVIDRGPELSTIFDVMARHNIKFIKGNHEYKFILEETGVIECRSRSRARTHIQMNGYSEDQQYSILHRMKKAPLFYRVQIGLNLFFLSHSIPRNMEDMNVVHSTEYNAADYCMRSKTPDWDKIKVDSDIMKDFALLETYIHGHQSWDYIDIDKQIENQKDLNRVVYNIDSGCVYGKGLTAICLNNNKVIHVPSIKEYQPEH